MNNTYFLYHKFILYKDKDEAIGPQKILKKFKLNQTISDWVALINNNTIPGITNQVKIQDKNNSISQKENNIIEFKI
mgnify:CR=1 FL=1